MNTDACPGYAAMAYQSWDSVYQSCEAWNSVLVRVERSLSYGARRKETMAHAAWKSGILPMLHAGHQRGHSPEVCRGSG